MDLSQLSRNDIMDANGIEHSTNVKQFTRTLTKGELTYTIPYDRVPSNKKMVEWFGELKYIEAWGK